MRLLNITILLLASALLVGCAGRAELIPNSDTNLRKTAAEFAADAASRHPYKSNAPKAGQAEARAQLGYVLDRLEIVNTSNTLWNDVEIWINENYVIFLPVMQPKILKTIPFQALYDGKGQSFPTGNGKWLNREPVIVKKVELYREGKLYTVPVQNAE